LSPNRLIPTFAALLLSAAAAFAAEPPEIPGHPLASASATLDDGDTTGALVQLKELEASTDASTAAVARLLRNQIEGTFQRRQAAWLNRNVIDTVVLVDDELSLIEAMSTWTPDTFFPVLIDDGWFSGLFIDAFKPSHVVRYKSAHEPTEKTIEAALAAVSKRHLAALLQSSIAKPPALPTPPPGLVVLDPHSPQRAAGLALALGHNQPLFFLSTPLSEHSILHGDEIEAFVDPIMQALLKSGSLTNENWAALTLAGPYPYRYEVAPPPADAAKKPERKQRGQPQGIMALDDLLGRVNSNRLAVTGRVVGDTTESTYQAMCSLFLQPSRALAVDDYSKREGPFIPYRLDKARELLASRIKSEILTGDQLTLAHFHTFTQPRNTFDLLLINSSGGPTQWAIDGNSGRTDDVPVGCPSVIHIVHSFSAADPWDPATIAGRALLGGAYWYFGSVHEPYLNAFARPTGFVLKSLAGTPLASAARFPPGPQFSQPWKLMLIGDPLFALRKTPAVRISSSLPLPRTQVATLTEPSLDDAAKLSPPRLARAALLAAADKHEVALAALPRSLAASHPVTLLLVRRALLAEFDNQLSSAAPPAAVEKTLTKLLSLDPTEEAAHALLERYLAAETKFGRRDPALAFLRSLSDQSTGPSRAAIQKFLPPQP
jgi:hypothetical protein